MVNHNTKNIGDLLTESYRNTRLTPIITDMINSIKEAHAVTDEQIAICLEKSALEFVKIMKARLRKQIIAHKLTKMPVFRKRRDVRRLRRILLAKLEGMLPDKAYRMIRAIGGLKLALPSIDAIRNMRREVNEELITELALTSDEKYFSCTVEEEKVLQMICRIHCSAFPDSPIPNDIEFKFSLDGRPNNGTNEVLIGIVPLNLKLPAQSGFSTFPLSILQCSEKEARTTANNTLRKLCQLKTMNFRAKETDEQKSYNLKIKMGSDFVSLWKCSGLQWCDNSELEFCPYCNKRSCDIQIENNDGVIARETIPGLDIASTDWIFCCLHMGMRVTERIVIGTILDLIPTKIDEIADKFKEYKYGTIRRDKDSLTAAINGNGVREILAEDLASDDESLISQLNSTTPNTVAIDRISSWVSSTKRNRVILILNSWSVIYRLISLQQDLTYTQVHILSEAISTMKKWWPLTFKSFLTPYLHVLFCHVVDLVNVVGSIGKYSQQGFEYANRLHRAIESRATNHGGGLGDLYLTEQLMLNFYARYKLAIELDLMVELNNLLNRKITRQNKPKKRRSSVAAKPRKRAPAKRRQTKSKRSNRSAQQVRGRFGPKQPKRIAKKSADQYEEIVENEVPLVENNQAIAEEYTIMEDNYVQTETNIQSVFDSFRFDEENEDREYFDENGTLFR